MLLLECVFNKINWGSFPDYLTFGLAALTSYYLYKTLKSQIKVQKYQNKLLKIEQRRYTKENIPTFKIEVEFYYNTLRFNEGDENKNYNYVLNYRFVLENSSAKDIRIEFFTPNNAEYEMDNLNIYEFDKLNIGDIFFIAYSSSGQTYNTIKFEGVKHNGFIHTNKIVIKYYDNLMNEISQTFTHTVINTPKPLTPHSHHPVILNNVFE